MRRREVVSIGAQRRAQWPEGLPHRRASDRDLGLRHRVFRSVLALYNSGRFTLRGARFLRRNSRISHLITSVDTGLFLQPRLDRQPPVTALDHMSAHTLGVVVGPDTQLQLETLLLPRGLVKVHPTVRYFWTIRDVLIRQQREGGSAQVWVATAMWPATRAANVPGWT